MSVSNTSFMTIENNSNSKGLHGDFTLKTISRLFLFKTLKTTLNSITILPFIFSFYSITKLSSRENTRVSIL